MELSVIRSAKFAYIAAFLAVLLVAVSLAITFGYISPDSWFYMMIARNLRHGHGCALSGQYMATYPCGYPTAIALTAPSATLGAMMISSKFTNLLLLCADAFFVYRASRHILLATFLILNPITLLIAMYTWSENLLLFCFCGVFYALSRLNDDDQSPYNYALLAVFLLIGCFTRYFFGPFAMILFICTLLTYGPRLAVRAFPCFCLAGLAYLGYRHFNWVMTGYATGMLRVPAPELPFMIGATFFEALTSNLWYPGIALVLLLGLSWRQVTFSRDLPSDPTRTASLFALLAGLGFLGLAFTLRATTLFDPYDTRTIGYGIVLTLSGLIGRFVHPRSENIWPVAALVASGLFSVVYADADSLPIYINHLLHGQYRFPAAAAAEFQRPHPPADIIVTFTIPNPDEKFGRMDTMAPVYYGEEVKLIVPKLGPDDTPDSARVFLHRLDHIGNKRCYFDFTAFASMKDVQDYLGGTTVTDQSFSLIPDGSVNTERDNLSPSFKAYMLAIAQPGKWLPCREVLAEPASQAALNP